MAIAVDATLLPLAYFKYYGFFALNLDRTRSARWGSAPSRR